MREEQFFGKILSLEQMAEDDLLSDYYYNATLWAMSEKVTEGTSATTFSPNDLCTRGQIVTFLYRYMGK